MSFHARPLLGPCQSSRRNFQMLTFVLGWQSSRQRKSTLVRMRHLARASPNEPRSKRHCRHHGYARPSLLPAQRLPGAPWSLSDPDPLRMIAAPLMARTILTALSQIPLLRRTHPNGGLSQRVRLVYQHQVVQTNRLVLSYGHLCECLDHNNYMHRRPI